MIQINGVGWFVGGLIIHFCGALALFCYLRGWRLENRQRAAWWQRYEAEAQSRHGALMRALHCDRTEAQSPNDPGPCAEACHDEGPPNGSADDDPTALKGLARKLYEVYDRPCESNGDWNHVKEYADLEDKIRAMVGAEPACCRRP